MIYLEIDQKKKEKKQQTITLEATTYILIFVHIQNYLPQSSAVNVNDHIESLQKKEKADKKMVYKILTTQKNTRKKLAKRNEKEKKENKRIQQGKQDVAAK